jgi:hypothetical protein
VKNEDSNPVERRAWVRYPCDWESACQPLAGTRGVQWQGKLLNLSRGGVAITLERRFEVGTILSVGVQGQAEEVLGTVVARVVHVLTQADGNWLHGCTFTSPISEEDLKALL